MSNYWQRLFGRAPDKPVVECQIDACDHGPRHMLIHEQLADYLPTVVKRLQRADFRLDSDNLGFDDVSVMLPSKFAKLARSSEAEEIIYEYLLQNYSYFVRDCRLSFNYRGKLQLTVWFRANPDD